MMSRSKIAISLLLALCACAAPAEPLASPAPLPREARSVPRATDTTLADEPAAPAEHHDAGNPIEIPRGGALVGLTIGDTPVYSASEGTDTLTTVPHTTLLGTVSVVQVVDAGDGARVEVMVPGRPNGLTGWVDSGDLMFYTVDNRLEIDLSERTLTYFEGDVVVMTSPVAVGSERNPTPTGTFFVTDRVSLADPSGPWGPHALGLSARSDTITEYNGGDGIIGIHGTNRPGSIGNAASLGCIRLPNDRVTALYALVDVGTPVEISA